MVGGRGIRSRGARLLVASWYVYVSAAALGAMVLSLLLLVPAVALGATAAVVLAVVLVL